MDNEWWWKVLSLSLYTRIHQHQVSGTLHLIDSSKYLMGLPINSRSYNCSSEFRWSFVIYSNKLCISLQNSSVRKGPKVRSQLNVSNSYFKMWCTRSMKNVALRPGVGEFAFAGNGEPHPAALANHGRICFLFNSSVRRGAYLQYGAAEDRSDTRRGRGDVRRPAVQSLDAWVASADVQNPSHSRRRRTGFHEDKRQTIRLDGKRIH